MTGFGSLLALAGACVVGWAVRDRTARVQRDRMVADHAAIRDELRGRIGDLRGQLALVREEAQADAYLTGINQGIRMERERWETKGRHPSTD